MTRSDPFASALDAHQAGRLNEAEAAYRAVLARDADRVDAVYLLGLLLHQRGQHDEALTWLRRAVDIDPARADFINSLGDAHRVRGEFVEARRCFEQALSLRPGYADAQTNLAMTLAASGARQDALLLLFNAVAADAQHATQRQLLAGLLEDVALTSGNALVRHVLRVLCLDEAISTQSLAGAVLGLFKGSDAFPPLLDAAMRGRDPFASDDPILAGAVAALIEDALLLTALPGLVIRDPEIERVFTHIRRWVLLRASRIDDGGPSIWYPGAALPPDWLSALAVQCWNTEFSFALGADEHALIDGARTALSAALSDWAAVPLDERAVQRARLEPALLLVALYGPLGDVSGIDRVGPIELENWSVPLRPLLSDQLLARAEEARVAATVPSLSGSADAVSQAVRAMYEANPYPRWVTLQRPTVVPIDAFIRSLRADVPATYANRRVLVAGCGSGQQPVQLALTHPDAVITAFDLSRTSLGYAARMARKHGVSSVKFAQGDILELPDRGDRYAMIACSGVLHHLREPLVGWERLVRLLDYEGVMKIGLYSTHARAGVAAARAFAAEQGFQSDANGLRACRQAILALPPAHPARAVIQSVDFYSLSGFRDLVMHVQEHTFTLPEIDRALELLGLRFLGFQLPQSVQMRFRTMFPEPAAALDLASWDAFERTHPDTFAAMYQFWCCRN